MNTLKGWITTLVLVATIMTSAMTANAGVIIAGRGDQPTQPCTETPTTKKDDLVGVIIAGVGVIIAGFTGVIIAGATSDGSTECGVIIAG